MGRRRSNLLYQKQNEMNDRSGDICLGQKKKEKKHSAHQIIHKRLDSGHIVHQINRKKHRVLNSFKFNKPEAKLGRAFGHPYQPKTPLGASLFSVRPSPCSVSALSETTTTAIHPGQHPSLVESSPLHPDARLALCTPSFSPSLAAYHLPLEMSSMADTTRDNCSVKYHSRFSF